MRLQTPICRTESQGFASLIRKLRRVEWGSLAILTALSLLIVLASNAGTLGLL